MTILHAGASGAPPWPLPCSIHGFITMQYPGSSSPPSAPYAPTAPLLTTTVRMPSAHCPEHLLFRKHLLFSRTLTIRPSFAHYLCMYLLERQTESPHPLGHSSNASNRRGGTQSGLSLDYLIHHRSSPGCTLISWDLGGGIESGHAVMELGHPNPHLDC